MNESPNDFSVHGDGFVLFLSICMKKKCSEVFDILSYTLKFIPLNCLTDE